ncbi:MAG: glycoside hydrolase family 127 protein [Planctomycetota bacterium]|nr:MAG: glycoside hydrolase family 127 protein [Planctomycetota bacterium]
MFRAITVLITCFSCMAVAQVSLVERPSTESRNDYYVSNQAPLVPSQWIALPLGSIEPQGWIREYLERQRDGLTGHLGEISVWLQKKDNAWLSPEGKGRWGWEELPYWLKGYGDIATILEDEKMIAETRVWIEGVLNSQRANGDFGPDQRFDDDGSRDYWANMIMLFCLHSYYEISDDPRVLNLMTRYFRYQGTVPDDEMLTHRWQHMRGGDNLYSIYWLYNRTGEDWLLDVAKKIHRNTANWRMKNDLPNMRNDQPNWHNVNVAQAFGEPATFYLQSHDAGDLQAAYDNFHEVRKRYGQVPGGMFGGDEHCRPGYDDPRQCVETCGMVEQMLSDELLLCISGDPFWADHCEEVAFNSYPAAVMPDFKSLRYLTAPNHVVSDRANHHPGINNDWPFLVMYPFSYRCCQHNHSHGWPYYAKHLWLASPDNGLCAALYGASMVRAKVGDGGTEVAMIQTTQYPFESRVRFTIKTAKPVTFPFYLRIPGWCDQASLMINGVQQSIESKPRHYLRLARSWQTGDTVTLDLPMQVKVRRWTQNHNSASVDYGPLTFSLQIKERLVQVDSREAALKDSQWQEGADPSQWPAYEILPDSAWNMGLMLDSSNPAASFDVQRRAWPSDNFPFTQDAVPITLTAQARVIPQWTLDEHGLCGVLQDSPVRSDEPTETVTLIPMGAARLRISAFPVVGDGPDAVDWQKGTLKIIVDPFTIADINEAVETFAPGWSAKHCLADDDTPPGLHNLGLHGLADWLVTHPLSEEVGCVLSKRIEVAAGKTQLCLTVGHHRQGDWVLVVKVNGDELLRTTVGSETTVNYTREFQIDLSPYAGSEIVLELMNEANGWSYETAYWGMIAIVTE